MVIFHSYVKLPEGNLDDYNSILESYGFNQVALRCPA